MARFEPNLESCVCLCFRLLFFSPVTFRRFLGTLCISLLFLLLSLDSCLFSFG